MTGDLGELLFQLFLSRKTTQGYLFRPMLIGGKWPTVDIYAEVITNDDKVRFAFFQVKTTTLGYAKRTKKLKVRMLKDDLIKLSGFYAPSYFVGIDYNEAHPFESKAYIYTIRGKHNKSISSLGTVYELDKHNEDNLIHLRDEILSFWDSSSVWNDKITYKSHFL